MRKSVFFMSSVKWCLSCPFFLMPFVSPIYIDEWGRGKSGDMNLCNASFYWQKHPRAKIKLVNYGHFYAKIALKWHIFAKNSSKNVGENAIKTYFCH